MTLTNRLTLFFLAAQVVVLAAFSVTQYVLARSHLCDQLDGHLSTTMDTLVALAEIEPDGLDWEPELRRLPAHWEGDPPVWATFDETGTRVDGAHSPVNALAEFTSPRPDPRPGNALRRMGRLRLAGCQADARVPRPRRDPQSPRSRAAPDERVSGTVGGSQHRRRT